MVGSGQQFAEVGRSGQQWEVVVRGGQWWILVVSGGQQWTSVVRSGQQWSAVAAVDGSEQQCLAVGGPSFFTNNLHRIIVFKANIP